MLLYRVRAGVLISTQVVKETKCYYWIDDFKFSLYSRIDKIDASTTPKMALQAELNQALESFGARKDHFEYASDRLEKIRKLIADFGGE